MVANLYLALFLNYSTKVGNPCNQNATLAV